MASTGVPERFAEFYENWIRQLEQFSHELVSLTLTSSTEQEQRALVSKLTSHHKEYYTVKWASARDDVLAFFCPPWVAPLEIACSWYTGWKPSLILRLADSMSQTRPSFRELTPSQLALLEELKAKVRMEEEKVEREMERLHVVVADKKVAQSAHLESVSPAEELAQVAVKVIKVGFEKVMKAADCVRLKALKGVLDIFNPMQCVEFLAAVSTVLLHVRRRSVTREST